MIGPEIAAQWLLASLTVGAILGILYGFLRPLRPKYTVFADLIFVLAAFYGWLYVGFQVCGGDIRFGCTTAIAAGGILWETTAGRFLRPAFRRFWLVFSRIVGFFLRPGKIFLQKVKKFCKLLLASGRKWFTIRGNRNRNHPNSGGDPHGKTKSALQTGAAQVQSHHQSRSASRRRAVHHRAGDPARLH